MLPHREWNRIPIVTTLRQSADNGDNTVEDWTTDHLEFNNGHAGKMGSFTPQTSVYQAWHSIFRPKSSDFALLAGMDECVDYGYWYTASLLSNEASESSFILYGFILAHPTDPNFWDFDLVNGKYYDGTNEWGAYPPGNAYGYFSWETINIGSLPYSGIDWSLSYGGGIPASNLYQEAFFRNGARVRAGGWLGGEAEPFSVGKSCAMWIGIQKIRANYLNPVVNSLSRSRMLPAGGVSLVLTGLGFDQDDVEIGDPTRNPNNTQGMDWNSLVDYIDFIGQQGQGTTTLTRGVDFTVDSDIQITITSMPALALGTYAIQLRKVDVTPGGGIDVSAYAGDWIADETGLVRPGNRMRFLVSEDASVTAPQILLTKWKFKRGDDETERWYSPIDIPSTDIFWDGRILRSSPITRGVNDRTGMFVTSSMSLDLSNSDKEFSILLAQYLLKNQIVEVLSATLGEPTASATPVIQMVVDDYTPKGDVFSVQLKDIMSKYFKKMLPAYKCTEDDYPNIHPDHKRPMPEILGNASLTTGDAPGAVEAIYIDTVNYKYLAARGSLHAVNEVYSDGVLKTLTTDYTISYEDGGRTIITFVADQGSNKITFNCEGYMFADWDSDNGYVQNPAYIIAFLVSFFTELPLEKMDLESFDTLATLFETLDIETSGKLILQNKRGAGDWMQELLFTYGTKGFPANDGRLTVERKDISNYLTSLTFFEQLDLLGPAQRKMGLNQAINRLQVKFDFIPTLNFYKGDDEDERQVSIDDFEAIMEPSTAWLFPWTDSETWIAQRLSEELLKLSYGNQKLLISIPIQNIGDMDIFSNFKYQDPYGFSLTGAGEVGRYYYIESVSYDFEGQKINIVAVDLQWLLRQYFILGDEDAIAELWADAGEYDKMFGYLCNELTNKFANKESGKLLIDENLII